QLRQRALHDGAPAGREGGGARAVVRGDRGAPLRTGRGRHRARRAPDLPGQARHAHRAERGGRPRLRVLLLHEPGAELARRAADPVAEGGVARARGGPGRARGGRPVTAAARVASSEIDLRVVRDALRSGRAPNAWMSAWLDEAYADPERFLDAVYAFARVRRGGLKSSRDRVVDLYYDVLTAHLGAPKRAFVAHERGSVVELSYEALFTRSGALAAAWHARGLEPGMCLALALPMGADFVVALLAALRLGAVIAPIPPHGPMFVANRLAALAPDALVVDPRARIAAPSDECLVLPLAGGSESAAPPSHGYEAAEPVLRLFPAFAAPDAPLLEPVTLGAGALHAALLCDATITFALDRHDTVAAPGFDPSAVQPTLLLAALMAGAGFAELAAPELARRPALLAELGVTVLGVAPSV